MRLPCYSGEEVMAKVYEPVLGGLLSAMRGQVLTICQQLGARRVLDVCCGPGGLTRKMAEKGLELCGLDMSWPMLQQARKHCGAADASVGLEPLFVQADATNLPFATVPAVQADATTMPFATAKAPFDVAVLALALHTMPANVGRAAVAQMLKVASHVIVADYRLAERNCDVPAVALGRTVEWLVGGEHYACYKAFMSAGGLEGFAHTQGYSPVQRYRILGGAGAIIVLKAGA